MDHQFFFSIFITILLSVFLVLKTWKKSKTSSFRKLPPGPWRLPIIGNIHQLVGFLPHRSLRDLARKYGPIMHLQLGEVSSIVISSPEAAKEVMKTHDILFAQRPFMLSASIIFYNGRDIAFAPYGEHWRQLRKIAILELLSAKRVQQFRFIREEEVSHLVKSISSSAGSPVNLGRMLLALSHSITSRTAFGDFCKQEQDSFIPFVEKCAKALGGFSIVDVFPSLKFLHSITGTRSKLMRLHQQLDEILERVISEHKTIKAMKKTGDESGGSDLVEVLLNLQEHGNLETPLTSEAIKGVILELILAGSETSSTTVEWAMSEMMKNPRVMEKAQTEVRHIFDKMKNVDETSLNQLKYLRSIIKETFRLHPPVPLLLPRESRERVEINGYEIPVKTKVIVNAWAIGRNPDYWSEPERFYPERFLESPIDYKGTDLQLIPFGAGRRMCPGMMYGSAVVELVLANLLYHFDWKLPRGGGVNYLDMSEIFGASVRMKNELYLIPTPYN